MDLSTSPTQQQLLDTIDRISERNGGIERARELVLSDGFDAALFAAVEEAGFAGLALEPGFAPVDAALVAGRLTELAGLIPAAATLLVFPKVTGRAAKGAVALVSANAGVPVRMLTAARHVLIDAGEEARLLDLRAGDVEPVDNDRTGWPLGRLSAEAAARAQGLGPGSGDRLRRWWQVALAVEASGAMRGALDRTVRYLGERVQFGRPLGSFQALQHRLARMAVLIEGAHWLALEAAAGDAEAQAAAAAAAHAIGAAPLVFRETQQMHGAMGFTREYPLHLWTMKLPALQRELGGLSAHARALTTARWGAAGRVGGFDQGVGN